MHKDPWDMDALPKKKRKLFPAAEKLGFVAMDILGPFPKSTRDLRCVFVITARFYKMTGVIPLLSTTGTDFAMKS